MTFILEPDLRRSPLYVESEHRPDREYDDHWPATVVHPNGSLIACSDRPLLNILARLVVEAHDAARAA